MKCNCLKNGATVYVPDEETYGKIVSYDSFLEWYLVELDDGPPWRGWYEAYDITVGCNCHSKKSNRVQQLEAVLREIQEVAASPGGNMTWIHAACREALGE